MCGAREATCLGWGNTDADLNPNTLVSTGSGRGAAVCFGGELRVCAAYSPPMLERTRTRMQAALERSQKSRSRLCFSDGWVSITAKPAIRAFG